jgi:hypothetical protein
MWCWDSLLNVLETTTPSNIYKVLKYYSLIILLTLLYQSDFQIVWWWYSGSMYFSEHGANIWQKKIFQIYCCSNEMLHFQALCLNNLHPQDRARLNVIWCWGVNTQHAKRYIHPASISLYCSLIFPFFWNVIIHTNSSFYTCHTCYMQQFQKFMVNVSLVTTA